MSNAEKLVALLGPTYFHVGSRAFALSAFAAMHKIGTGEALQVLAAGEQAGWVTGQAGYYQLTEEGMSACMA